MEFKVGDLYCIIVQDFQCPGVI